ncbi:MAG: cobalt-precorrin-5B (C1)-methyltransferase [Clostridia bacterium]|nr:cobalt-precorrin-5B (C1)-methyltransferase [Clostridia bacterium]
MMEEILVARKLRRGYTTGTCAAAASKAAAIALWQGKKVENVTLTLPRGERVNIPVSVRETSFGTEAKVIKDAGDDPDITNGVAIYAHARKREQGLVLKGGKGIGVVTCPGLAVPVGEAAINPVPRQMIEEAVAPIIDTGKGIELTISIPEGEKLAKKTLNPRLGIEGGLSILGTTGIVEPMSEEAFRSSLLPQIDVAKAAGWDTLILTPGRMGQRQAEEKYGLPSNAIVLTSNFLGFMLEGCVERGIKRVLLWGHAGKLVKVAGGIFYTHSRIADSRQEILAAWAAAYGAPQNVVNQILMSTTVEAVFDLIPNTGWGEGFLDKLAGRASQRAQNFVFDELEVGTVLLNLKGQMIGSDQVAKEILEAYSWQTKKDG